MFKVEVASVQVSNVKGKQKTFKQKAGKRSDWKKAYVKLKPGFDIDFMGS
jgi:large subunit ribosomal protein L23